MRYHLWPRGHSTFDVYRGVRHVGSVWHYHEGWAAFDRQYRMVSGFHATEDEAALALLKPARVTS